MLDVSSMKNGNLDVLETAREIGSPSVNARCFGCKTWSSPGCKGRAVFPWGLCLLLGLFPSPFLLLFPPFCSFSRSRGLGSARCPPGGGLCPCPAAAAGEGGAPRPWPEPWRKSKIKICKGPWAFLVLAPPEGGSALTGPEPWPYPVPLLGAEPRTNSPRDVHCCRLSQWPCCHPSGLCLSSSFLCFQRLLWNSFPASRR